MNNRTLFQMLGSIPGQREIFEEICRKVVRAEHPGAWSLREHQGDHGIDFQVGDLAIINGGGPPVYPGLPGHEPALVVARLIASKIRQATNELKNVVPEPGSYVSESNYFNDSWQESFWGPNYSRLLAIKKKYDPAGLFFVHHGVGSKEWSADGFTRKS